MNIENLQFLKLTNNFFLIKFISYKHILKKNIFKYIYLYITLNINIKKEKTYLNEYDE
jgi:hypothetical protein